MRLDHLSYAAGPDGLSATAERLGDLLGERFVDGGVHPRFGTRNMLLPLTGGTYLEVVTVLDHPASDKVPFGQAVRARSAAGGGWLAWVIAVDDLHATEQRLGQQALPGNRHRPDGVELAWHQVGVTDFSVDPQLPFFIKWDIPPELHPGAGASGRLALEGLDIYGDPDRIAQWLGTDPAAALDGVRLEWHPPTDSSGIASARFRTSTGLVRI